MDLPHPVEHFLVLQQEADTGPARNDENIGARNLVEGVLDVDRQARGCRTDRAKLLADPDDFRPGHPAQQFCGADDVEHRNLIEDKRGDFHSASSLTNARWKASTAGPISLRGCPAPPATCRRRSVRPRANESELQATGTEGASTSATAAAPSLKPRPNLKRKITGDEFFPSFEVRDLLGQEIGKFQR